MEDGGGLVRGHQLRELRAQLSTLLRADGSCALEQGRTVLWCAVNGPGDVPSSRRLSDRLLIEVLCRQPHSVKISRLLTAALEHCVDIVRYPRSLLCVTLQQLQPDGSESAAALNAACLAVLDSGVNMKATFCGVTVAYSHGELILDPTRAQCSNAQAIYTFAFIYSEKDSLRMVACDTDGVFDYNTFEAARRLAQEASADIFMFYRETLQRKLSVDIWK